MIRDNQHPLARFYGCWADTFAVLPGWHQPAAEPPNPLNDPVPTDNDWPGRPTYNV